MIYKIKFFVTIRYLIPGLVLFLSVTHSVASGAASVPILFVQVSTGVTYTGPSQLHFPEAGVSFRLPAGWKGGIPPNQDVFVLGNNPIAGIGIISIKNTTRTEARSTMQQAIPFLGNTRLILAGKIQHRNNRLFGLYRVQGAKEPMAAYVVAVFTGRGKAVTFLIASRRKHIKRLSRDVTLMMNSVIIKRPVINAGKAELINALKGKKLTHIQTGSTTRLRIDLYFCRDGTFRRRAHTGGVDATYSMYTSRSGNGFWEVQNDDTFVLKFTNGSNVTMTVTTKKGKVFLNGVRYYRAGAAGC